MPAEPTTVDSCRVDHHLLEAAVARLFELTGCPRADAAGIAEILVLSDLRGLDSHGVRFAARYLRGLRRGLLNCAPRMELVRRRGATAVLDADNGLGFVSARAAMTTAMELAAEHGIGAVAVRNSNHFGMAAFYAMQALERGMIGHATTDGPPHTVIWGGREPMVSNDPIAWAFPTRTSPPIVVDTALTGVKEKIRIAAERGDPIPIGWGIGPDGAETTDAELALQGALLPIGGPKGSSLIVANEMLCGALAGARFSFEVSRALVMGADHHDEWRCGHFLAAIDIEAFTERETFLDRIEEFCRTMREAAPARGVDRVHLPGEHAWLAAEAARRDGVRIARATLVELEGAAADLGEPMSFTRMGPA
ncbi:MAG TPA: Ldh family oxidoreductase [Candidatus Dormibacteraeota bacterium]|nr:Ldh family oxidoreductase [Candidatus Dormibacteraeota bacterium]